MRKHMHGSYKTLLAMAGALGAMGLCAGQANGAEALWVSAPTWSYSAAAAESPIGWAYFWGLSVGAGSYSFAYAFSNDGIGDAAYAFAEASAGQGGMGAVQVGGVADPYAEISLDINPLDPSDPRGYPTTKGSDPFSSSYTVSPTGITFDGTNGAHGNELDGMDGLQAFTYSGLTDETTLEGELGAANDGGNSQTGDVTDINTFATDFGLVPLDDLITDPSSLTGITFTENDASVDPSQVILIGIQDAEIPEPATMSLMALGGMAMVTSRKRRRRAD